MVSRYEEIDGSCLLQNAHSFHLPCRGRGNSRVPKTQTLLLLLLLSTKYNIILDEKGYKKEIYIFSIHNRKFIKPYPTQLENPLESSNEPQRFREMKSLRLAPKYLFIFDFALPHKNPNLRSLANAKLGLNISAI